MCPRVRNLHVTDQISQNCTLKLALQTSGHRRLISGSERRDSFCGVPSSTKGILAFTSAFDGLLLCFWFKHESFFACSSRSLSGTNKVTILIDHDGGYSTTKAIGIEGAVEPANAGRQPCDGRFESDLRPFPKMETW